MTLKWFLLTSVASYTSWCCCAVVALIFSRCVTVCHNFAYKRWRNATMAICFRLFVYDFNLCNECLSEHWRIMWGQVFEERTCNITSYTQRYPGWASMPSGIAALSVGLCTQVWAVSPVTPWYSEEIRPYCSDRHLSVSEITEHPSNVKGNGTNKLINCAAWLCS